MSNDAQVPPVGEPVRVIWDELHTAEGPLIVGKELTVICIAVDVFAAHPLDVTVLLNQVVCVKAPGV